MDGDCLEPLWQHLEHWAMGTHPPVEAMVLAQARVCAVCRIGVAQHSTKEAANKDEGSHKDLKHHANEFVVTTANTGLCWSAQNRDESPLILSHCLKSSRPN